MIKRIEKPPQEIEKEFSNIRSEINKYVLSEKSFRIPKSTLFDQLEKEYKKIVREYTLRRDRKNLLHVSHNFYWSIIFKFLESDINKSLDLFFKALTALIDRNLEFPYRSEVLEKMLGTYELAIIKISESNGVSSDIFQDKFEKLINEKIIKIEEPSERLAQILNILCGILIKSITERIKKLRISFVENEELKELEKKIGSIIETSGRLTSDKIREILLSRCFESYYILKKRQLHYLVQFIFFESDEEKKNKSQNLVDQIVKQMISYADLSLKHCNKYLKHLPEESLELDNIKLMKSLKEIDALCSRYYEKAYSEKDIFKAWKQIDTIRHFLVKKYFSEHIKLSQELLNYFSEEWALLDIFAKANLFRIEVEKRESIVHQEWEKMIFQNILISLNNIKKLFKYELTKEKDYQLKIIAAQFSGGFSEYFIHDLFEEYHDCCIVDNQTPQDFKKLMELIRQARRDDIKRGDVIEKDKPDIDIHVRKRCAVFLKNATLYSDEFQQIKRELDLCNKVKIKDVLYAINFVKNIKEIERVYLLFEDLVKRYTDINIQIVDIKDMVEAFLNELKRSGKSKLNFSRLDLYKILDY